MLLFNLLLLDIIKRSIRVPEGPLAEQLRQFEMDGDIQEDDLVYALALAAEGRRRLTLAPDLPSTS